MLCGTVVVVTLYWNINFFRILKFGCTAYIFIVMITRIETWPRIIVLEFGLYKYEHVFSGTTSSAADFWCRTIYLYTNTWTRELNTARSGHSWVRVLLLLLLLPMTCIYKIKHIKATGQRRAYSSISKQLSLSCKNSKTYLRARKLKPPSSRDTPRGAQYDIPMRTRRNNAQMYT